MFEFTVAQLFWDSKEKFWFSIGSIDTFGDWQGALFHIENDYGTWKKDLFYLGDLIRKWKER
jgi:hypothetical protein